MVAHCTEVAQVLSASLRTRAKDVVTLLGKSSLSRAQSGVTTAGVRAGRSGRAAAGARPTVLPRARRSPGPHAWRSRSGAAGGACVLTPDTGSDGDQHI